jgi:signal transduction histidine kinase
MPVGWVRGVLHPERALHQVMHGIIQPGMQQRVRAHSGAYDQATMSSTAHQIVVVALLLATVSGLFVAGQVGQRRMEEATRRIQIHAQRQRSLGDLSQLLRQAESSQRGYILLGNAGYLNPFTQASARFDSVLNQLAMAFTTAEAPPRADIEQLKHLSRAKFAEMHQAVELFQTLGRAAALQLIRTDVGAATMTEIDDLVNKIEAQDTNETLEATREWKTNRWVSVAVTSAALLASAGLLLLLTRLTLRQLRSKERQAEQLATRQGELEQLVQQRTEELSVLSTHLQTLAEREKAALSRELHDELGGLLVAARMDLSWLEERVNSDDPQVKAYFWRIQQALEQGFDFKRRVIENLRPTLLDNLGVFSALRWQVAEYCERAGVKSVERYPAEEPQLTSQAAIAVFRIAQEALTNVLKHAQARTVEVVIEIQPPWLLLRVRDDGIGLALNRLRALGSHGFAAMRQRARGLGGQLELRRPAQGGTQIDVRLPLERVLAEGVTTTANVPVV